MEKRILDEATRKALQGYNPFSAGATIDVTPDEYKPVPATEQPKFTIRCMTKEEKTKYTSIYASVKRDDKTGEAPESEWSVAAEKLDEIYNACLVGWRDYFDAGTGEEIQFAPNMLGTLLPWVQVFIRAQIRKISNLTPVEALSLK